MSTFVWNSITANFNSDSAREQFINTALEDTFLLMKEQNVDCDYYLDKNENDGNFSVGFTFGGTQSLKDATNMDGNSNTNNCLAPILEQIPLVDGEWSLEEEWMDDTAIGKDLYFSDKPFESYTGSWILSLDTDSPDEVDEFREFLDEEMPVNYSHLLESITDDEIQTLIDVIGYEEQAYIVDGDFPKELDLVGKLVLGDNDYVPASRPTI